jgi:pimeloyl-[acyl-carrier protein] methyl ester esterase
MKLYHQTTGSGPDLVLLHGWGMSGAVWERVLPHLARNHRVWRIDLPGHGASGYDPRSASLEEWASACLAVAPERACWVGWSLGGQIALQCALLAPRRVERLLLVASTPRFVQGEGWAHAMETQTLQLFGQTLQRNPRQTLARFLSLQLQGDEAVRETLRLLRREVARRPEPDPLALQHGLDLLQRVDLRERLGELTCPLRWLLGERDTLVPATVGPDLESLSGAGADRVPGAAHVPFLSHPEPCLAWLEQNLLRQHEPLPA